MASLGRRRVDLMVAQPTGVCGPREDRARRPAAHQPDVRHSVRESRCPAGMTATSGSSASCTRHLASCSCATTRRRDRLRARRHRRHSPGPPPPAESGARRPPPRSRPVQRRPGEWLRRSAPRRGSTPRDYAFVLDLSGCWPNAPGVRLRRSARPQHPPPATIRLLSERPTTGRHQDRPPKMNAAEPRSGPHPTPGR